MHVVFDDSSFMSCAGGQVAVRHKRQFLTMATDQQSTMSGRSEMSAPWYFRNDPQIAISRSMTAFAS